MSTNYHEFNTFAQAMRLLDQYIQDGGVKLPLLTILEQREGCVGKQSELDVSYESYSIVANYPSVILEIHYTGVKHCFNGIFDPWTRVGDIRMQLMVGQKGRILREKVICVEIETLQRVDVHI